MLNEHKLRHTFRNSVNAMCDCNGEVETTNHFFLRGKFYRDYRNNPFSTIYHFALDTHTLNDESLVRLTDFVTNKSISEATILFLKETYCFGKPLFRPYSTA